MPLHLGYLASAVLFAGLIALPAIDWRRFDLNTMVAFWAAYVVTRPLGASIPDWLRKPPAHTGLGLGDGSSCSLRSSPTSPSPAFAGGVVEIGLDRGGGAAEPAGDLRDRQPFGLAV